VRPLLTLVSRLIDVRPGEGARVFRMFALLGLIIATNYVLKPVRSSLFLSRIGASFLPYVYVVVAGVLGVVATVFARVAPRMNLPRVIVGLAGFFALNLTLFWIAAASGVRVTGFLFYVWVSIVVALLPSVFWLFANYVFYAHEGRRLFPVVMAGGLSGSILGGVATTLLVPVVGTMGLLPAAALLFLSIAALAEVTARRERPRMNERERDLRRHDRIRISPTETTPYRALARSPYLKRLAALTLLTGLSSTLLDYQFSSVVEEAFPGEDSLTGFFGTFFAGVNLLAFALQLSVSGQLLSRIGVGAGLLLLPLGLLASSVSFVLFPSLLTACLLKVADDGLGNSTNRASQEVLYLPLALSVKNRLKIWIDLFVERASRGAAGLFLILSTAAASFTTREIGYAVLVLLVPWIWLVLSLRREYVATLKASLAKRDITDLDSVLRDPASRGVFLQTLRGKDEKEIAYALDLVQGVREAGILEEVKRLVSHESPRVRAAALRALQADPARMGGSGALARLVEDRDPETAAEALALWLRLEPEGAKDAFQRLAERADVPRIAAVFDSLEGTHFLPDAALREMVAQYAGRTAPEERRLAARALSFLPPDREAEDLLIRLLDDPDVEVARAAALGAGGYTSEGVFDALVRALARRPIRAQLRRALARFEGAAVPKLEERLHDPTLHPAARRAIPRAIAEIADPRSVEALFRCLPAEDPRLHYQAIKSLGRLRSRGRGLRFPRSDTDRLLAHERDALVDLADLERTVASPAGGTGSHRLLLQALEERIDYTRERIFRLLGLTYRQDEIASLWTRISTGPPSVKATAIEYLAALLSRPHRATLLPVLELTTRLEGKRGAGLPAVSIEEALQRLATGSDYWVAACAVAWAGDLRLRGLVPLFTKLRGHRSILVREAAERALALVQNGTSVT
jgi:AAA family ATP:ADP antiporter